MTEGETICEGTVVQLDLSEAELEVRNEHITSFVRETADRAGVDGAVLGMSGGIDSTLTAYLAVEALGEEGLRGLILPSKVNPEESMSDAERVAESLDIAYEVVGIEPIVDAVTDAYPAGEGDREAVGNVRARVRGVLNYFVANAEDRLVLGTGNRSEALTGYFTKYGDQAVDCNPIGNLYKRQVRQLARHVGVPEDIVTKPPSAELWADQTDEGELGLDYDTLDAVLALRIDGPLSRSATARTLGVDETAVQRVENLVAGSAHKREMPPAPEPL